MRAGRALMSAGFTLLVITLANPILIKGSTAIPAVFGPHWMSVSSPRTGAVCVPYRIDISNIQDQLSRNRLIYTFGQIGHGAALVITR